MVWGFFVWQARSDSKPHAETRLDKRGAHCLPCCRHSCCDGMQGAPLIAMHRFFAERGMHVTSRCMCPACFVACMAWGSSPFEALQLGNAVRFSWGVRVVTATVPCVCVCVTSVRARVRGSTVCVSMLLIQGCMDLHAV